MIVVADTSPLNYLVLIGEIDVLPTLYQRILIPKRVHSEMLDVGTPSLVHSWAVDIPSWCEVRPPRETLGPAFEGLDAGEHDAILLAVGSGADALLIDDGPGRRAARLKSIPVTGTLGVLELAAGRGLLDFRDAFHRLGQTNFRASEIVKSDFLKRNP